MDRPWSPDHQLQTQKTVRSSRQTGSSCLMINLSCCYIYQPIPVWHYLQSRISSLIHDRSRRKYHDDRSPSSYHSKATIRLRGAGYGFGNLSARLTLLSMSGEAGLYVLLPTRGSTYAICKLPEVTWRCHSTLAYGAPDRSRGRSRSRNFFMRVYGDQVWLTGVIPSQHAYSGQDTASLFLISSYAWTVLEPGGETFFQMVDRGLDEYFQVSPSDVGFGGDGLADASVSFYIRQLDTWSLDLSSGRYVPWTYFLVDWHVLDSFTGNFCFLQLLEGGISGFVARKSGSKVVGACFFVEPMDFTSMLACLDVEFAFFFGSFAGCREAVFPALGQGAFRGTTPIEVDEH
ncbi:hypothetical protein YC2023_004547 [Brassica napus]